MATNLQVILEVAVQNKLCSREELTLPAEDATSSRLHARRLAVNITASRSSESDSSTAGDAMLKEQNVALRTAQEFLQAHSHGGVSNDKAEGHARLLEP